MTIINKPLTPPSHHQHRRGRCGHCHRDRDRRIPYLPKEILQEIFNKISLPIKTITQFQNTTTHDNQISTIFSDSKFVEKQVNHYTLPCVLAYNADDDHNKSFHLFEGKKDDNEFFSMEISMDFMKNHVNTTTRNIEILDSCNGLLLLTDRRFLWVVNPLTREIITLPKPNIEGFFSGDKSCYVIGFSTKCDKYKVVRLVGGLTQAVGGYYLEFSWYGEVLTLGTTTWRRINGCAQVLQNAVIEDKELVMNNGALYWLIHLGNKHEILRFEVDLEVFELIPSPLDEPGLGLGLGFGFSLCSLGVVDDMLCVTRYNRRGRRLCKDDDLSHGLELWVLRDCGVWNLWKKMSVVYVENMRCLRKIKLIRVSENDEEILMMLQDPLKLVYYDTTKRTIREVRIDDGVNCENMKGVIFCPSFRSITTYIDS